MSGEHTFIVRRDVKIAKEFFMKTKRFSIFGLSAVLSALGVAVTIIASGMLVTACFSLPKTAKVGFNSLMDTNVPTQEHCVLDFAMFLHDVTLDGVFYLEMPSVAIPPGEHTITTIANAKQSSADRYGNSITVDNYMTGYMTITASFTPGHIYFLDYDGESETLILVDETDPDTAWADNNTKKNQAERRVKNAKKMLASAKYPKNVQNIPVGEPTIFEGTWVLPGQVITTYTFRGNTITQRTNNTVMEGTFEFSDGTLTIVFTKAMGTELPKSSRINQAFTYSFAPEGTLALTLNGATMNLTKQ
jgi:hypothetical protein